MIEGLEWREGFIFIWQRHRRTSLEEKIEKKNTGEFSGKSILGKT